MVNVQLRKANKLKAPEALFVNFPYDMQKVEKIKSLPVRFYDPGTKSWEVPVHEINDVIQLFDGERLTITGKVTTKCKSASVAQPTVVVPLNTTKIEKLISEHPFKVKPFDHQLEGFRHALSTPKFLLGDEQGLGKSMQAIHTAIARKNEFKYCLVICGVNTLKWNWMEEIKIHSNENGHIIGSKRDSRGRIQDGSVKERVADLDRDIPALFLITNIETLRNVKIQEKLKQMCDDGIIGMVIFDECHASKNPTSQQGKAIHKLNATYKMAMTGTPLMNNPMDLYNLLKWLGAETHNFYQFRARYCIMGGYEGREIVGYKNMNELRDRVSAVMLRRKKDEVLNLPPKIKTTEYVEMTAKQAQLYREVKEVIMQNIDEVVLSDNPLAQLLRLRQVTGHTSILSQKISESAKMDRLKELVQEVTESGGKVIVFSNWTQITNIIEKELASYNPAVITGEIKDRQGMVNKFQNDPTCKVIVGTVGAMGTGLTLTAANTVIFIDKPWNPARTEQSEDRAHRIGTTGTVSIISLVTRDTIDERIEEILVEKGDLVEALIEGKMNKLSKKELVDRLLS